MKRLITVPVAGSESVRIEPDLIPTHVRMNLAQAFSEELNRMKKDPAFMARYEAWKRQRRKKSETEGTEKAG